MLLPWTRRYCVTALSGMPPWAVDVTGLRAVANPPDDALHQHLRHLQAREWLYELRRVPE